ncbi:MAG: ABC transporter permease [Armatimonadetes bacterium]|nr:ABC transporter permease [Armatimonadota bacterium]
MRIYHIIRKEIIQVRRDPKMMFLILVAPILQLLIFGYAITSDIQHISTAVLDMDNTAQSRELISKFEASPIYFDINRRLSSPDEISGLLDSGKAQMVIWVPKGFAANIGKAKPAEVQVAIDGTDSATASAVGGYVNAIAGRHSQTLIVRTLRYRGQSAVPLAQVNAQVRAWYNPDLKSIYFLVPGVLCLLLVITTTMLTSLAVVREREIGTLEQIIVTPIKPFELVIGKTVPFAIIAYVNVLMIVAGATLWFGVPIRGSLLLLFALTAVFLTASLGTGLFVSTVSKTQQQAMMVSFFILQPSILLSGFMFPIDNMPRIIQYLVYLLPLRYYLEIIRGIFLRGVGIAVLWPQALALFILGGILITASTLRFTKKVV